MFFLLRDRRDFVAGLILGCLIFKPQLGVAAAVVFLATGAWKTLAGAALSAAGQLCIAALYYGTDPLRQWLHMLRNAPALLPLLEPRLYQTHCLRTFWTMLIPWPGLALALFGLSAARRSRGYGRMLEAPECVAAAEVFNASALATC